LGLSASDLLTLPLDERVGAINAAIEDFVPAAERAAVAGQLFGEEGSIAMSRIDTATLRQATEDVRAFGVVVSEADAEQIERTNDALSRLGLIWRGLSNQLAVAAAPALEAVTDAMATFASRTGPLGQTIARLFDNIGRLTTYAATFAGFLASRWVAGLAAAALSVRGLATALVVLRGALIRTGIGALIVGAGELIYQFTKLVRGAGGFGEAMRHLKNVAVEVWERIGDGAWSIVLRLRSVANGLKAAWFDALAAMQDKWARFLKTISGALFRIPGMNGLAMDIGFDSAFAGQAVDQLRRSADEFRFFATNLGDQADVLAGNITRPLDSMIALREAMKGAGEDGADALNEAAAAADRVTEALGAAGEAGRAAGAANAGGADQAAPGWAAVTATLADYAAKARDIGADIGQSLVGAFRSAENAVAEFVKSGKLDFRDLVTSLIADLARLAARRFILGPMASALGGILGGAGGLFANILHAGGVVGGPAPSRMVPAMAFAAAPRMHGGGWVGLRPDEVPAILQRGERVLSRREAQVYGAGAGVTININTRDAESFRQSRTQIAADIARAVSLGRRGL
ncbi:MAG TPA: phage tail tape measure protein, partial [Thermopetrobacter sp.]|nr:phage tail tape measure protein [Thermopetrobacter sp.]